MQRRIIAKADAEARFICSQLVQDRIWTIQTAWVLRTMVCTTSFGLPGPTCRFQNLSAKSRQLPGSQTFQETGWQSTKQLLMSWARPYMEHVETLELSFLRIQRSSIYYMGFYGILWALFYFFCSIFDSLASSHPPWSWEGTA